MTRWGTPRRNHAVPQFLILKSEFKKGENSMIDNEKVEEIFLVLEDKLDKTVNVLQSD